MHVDRPRAGGEIGAHVENRAMKVVSRKTRMGPGAGHEEQRVQRVMNHDSVLRPVMRRLPRHGEPISLALYPARGREGLDIAVEDARIGLERLDRNLPGDEGIKVARMKG